MLSSLDKLNSRPCSEGICSILWEDKCMNPSSSNSNSRSEGINATKGIQKYHISSKERKLLMARKSDALTLSMLVVGRLCGGVWVVSK